MTTREALEAALVATPDDAVLHAAYADFLIEKSDPRGEFIRLQLAAEDRNQPAAKLRELEQAAFEVRQQHEQEWLGELRTCLQRPPTAVSVAEPMEPNVSINWRRGWIDSVRVGQLSWQIVQAIAGNPLTRLLGSLVIEHNQQVIETRTQPYEMPFEVSLDPLMRAGLFANLRHFELGSSERQLVAEGWGPHEEVAAMPRLESLKLCVELFSESGLFGGDYPRLHTIHLTYNNPRCRFYVLGYNPGLPNLRRLHLDTVTLAPPHGELGPEREPITPGDLQSFFRSQYLKSLEYFTFRNGEFADAGVEELLASGFVHRLKGLDLCRCSITDDGARLLAAHPHVPRLEYLHLDGNLLSPIGIAELEETGVAVSQNQFFANGPDDGMWDDEDLRAE